MSHLEGRAAGAEHPSWGVLGAGTHCPAPCSAPFTGVTPWAPTWSRGCVSWGAEKAQEPQAVLQGHLGDWGKPLEASPALWEAEPPCSFHKVSIPTRVLSAGWAPRGLVLRTCTLSEGMSVPSQIIVAGQQPPAQSPELPRAPPQGGRGPQGSWM